VVVIYNLPNRDCAAKASNGELHVEQDGEVRYRREFIDPIAKHFAEHANQEAPAALLSVISQRPAGGETASLLSTTSKPVSSVHGTHARDLARRPLVLVGALAALLGIVLTFVLTERAPAANESPARSLAVVHPAALHLLHALLRVEVPGESDGSRNRGVAGSTSDPESGGILDPAAGEWFPEQALELVRLASPKLFF
jgi:cellulase/cellobiase CelA1